jgi:hypothetical protein
MKEIIRCCLIFLHPVKHSMFTRAIVVRHDSELIRESVFAYANLFVDEENVHMTQIESWKNKNIDGLYTKTTQKGGFSKLCVKIYNRCYIDPLHCSTRKHNLVSFFGRIVIWQYNCIVLIVFFYIFCFFQEKTLGDISFKLETKIMNFMSGFFLK